MDQAKLIKALNDLVNRIDAHYTELLDNPMTPFNRVNLYAENSERLTAQVNAVIKIAIEFPAPALTPSAVLRCECGGPKRREQ